MLWQGKPLEDYSKKELIVIIEALRNNIRRQTERHVRQLEELVAPKVD
jgi:hypothetical protein